MIGIALSFIGLLFCLVGGVVVAIAMGDLREIRKSRKDELPYTKAVEKYKFLRVLEKKDFKNKKRVNKFIAKQIGVSLVGFIVGLGILGLGIWILM